MSDVFASPTQTTTTLVMDLKPKASPGQIITEAYTHAAVYYLTSTLIYKGYDILTDGVTVPRWRKKAKTLLTNLAEKL